MQKVLEKIKTSLNIMKKDNDFNPTLYIGKTSDFNFSWERHMEEGFPVLLRIAEGKPEDISSLENSLIEWAKKDDNWKCINKNSGSAGNNDADKLYICLSESIQNDPMCEYAETILLGDSFPIKLGNE